MGKLRLLSLLTGAAIAGGILYVKKQRETAGDTEEFEDLEPDEAAEAAEKYEDEDGETEEAEAGGAAEKKAIFTDEVRAIAEEAAKHLKESAGLAAAGAGKVCEEVKDIVKNSPVISDWKEEARSLAEEIGTGLRKAADNLHTAVEEARETAAGKADSAVAESEEADSVIDAELQEAGEPKDE